MRILAVFPNMKPYMGKVSSKIITFDMIVMSIVFTINYV